MLHAFETHDFLKAVDDFDHHARQGRATLAGNSCRKVERPPVRVRSYPPLGSPAAALAVCRDLWALARSGQGSLVAVFNGPAIPEGARFDALLWQQLQRMHGVDAARFDWHAESLEDPMQRRFSIGGQTWHYRGLAPSADGRLPSVIFQALGD